MKALHLTTYKIYSKTPLRIVALSDVHFSYLVKDETLEAVVELITALKPNYIFCPGDLIDYLDMVDAESERQRLMSWLKKLGKIAPVIISLGNHDLYRKNPHCMAGQQQFSAFFSHQHQQDYSSDISSELARLWLIERYSEFYEEVRQLPNIYVLDDAVYTDKNIWVLGITLPPSYYENGRADKKTLLKPGIESKDKFLQTLQELGSKKAQDADGKKLKFNNLYHLPTKQLKFALIHSPVYLTDKAVTAKLAEYDYFIAGHMHNGVVPPVLDELWRGSRGVISPTRNFLPKDIRRTFPQYHDKLIITGAITTIHECSGKLAHLNAFFPAYLSLLDFTNDSAYQRKPYVRKQYLGYGQKPKV